MTSSLPLQVLAIVNGDPTSNAGARLRVKNWVDALAADSGLDVCIARRPKFARQLFHLVREWLRNLRPPTASSLATGPGQVVIVQKAFSLEMVALLLYLRLRGVAVIQDICDPPIKVFNPQPFSKPFFAVFYLSLVGHYLVDYITVSSSVLARSFSASPSPVAYIPDCIDFRSVPRDSSPPTPSISYLNREGSWEKASLHPLRLLWFGGAARAGTHAGIEELYASTPILEDLAIHCRIFLSICTILERDNLPAFHEWASRLSFLDIAYYPWSLPVQEFLLDACDFCFLPRLQSLGTFYKSPNRIVLAAHHGRRTLSNMIPSEDYDPLQILLPSELLATPRSLAAWGESFPPPQVPAAWTPPVICGQWRQVIHAAWGRCKQRPMPALSQRLSLWVLLFLLLLTIGAINLNKSSRKSLRKILPKRFLRNKRKSR